jgi:Holliday junction resolvase-like predicted endonuclease
MKLKPKNLCTKLSVVNGVGLCGIRKCICECWHCEYKTQCQRGFEKCLLKEDIVEIPNVHTYYERAAKTAEEKIREIFDTEDSVKISGGLAFHREIEILHCFFETPGDLPSTVSTVNTYIKDDLSEISHSDIQENEVAVKVWNLIITKESFQYQIARLRSGDVVCYGNKDAIEELEDLVVKPLRAIEELNTAMERGTPPPVEGHCFKQAYSEKMASVMEWCLKNINQMDIWDYSLHQNFLLILNHIEQVGISGRISPQVCYKLAYPHYAGMLHTCRYTFARFPSIKKVAKINNGIDAVIAKKFGITFEIGRSYDNFLFQLWKTFNTGQIHYHEKIGNDTPQYQFNTQDGVLFGSLLLFGFISKNFDYVCSKPYERGRLFEDYLEKELVDRRVSIIKRNLIIPNGEIDFLCEKHGKLYFIEAKDYSPWFDESYIGSATYAKRVTEISRKLEKTTPRLQ